MTVADYDSLRDLFNKRLRWIVVMRHMRPWGHLGLIFTLGLALGAGRGCGSTYARGCGWLPRNVFCAALRDDLAGREAGASSIACRGKSTYCFLCGTRWQR